MIDTIATVLLLYGCALGVGVLWGLGFALLGREPELNTQMTDSLTSLLSRSSEQEAVEASLRRRREAPPH